MPRASFTRMTSHSWLHAGGRAARALWSVGSKTGGAHLVFVLYVWPRSATSATWTTCCRQCSWGAARLSLAQPHRRNEMKRFLRLVIIAIAICAILVAALDVRCGTI